MNDYVHRGVIVRPATSPRSRARVRVLVVDGGSGAMRVVSSLEAPSLFERGDLVVVNDAATLPASFFMKTEQTEKDRIVRDVELRLVGSIDDRRWLVALFGKGDHRTRTEDREAAPMLDVGARLFAGVRLVATVTARRPESTRLVEVELSIAEEPRAPLSAIWAELYRMGRPVQYAHVPSPLALWDVQNVYSGRPWAVEMPSAGRLFRADTLLALRRAGVEIARVTHAAGISSVGDPAVDAMLPFPERFEVGEATWEAIAHTRTRGGRVVAIGTSVVRALEGGVRANARRGITDLRIGPRTRRAVVDAVLTGVHEADTSHYALLGAFASQEILARAHARAAREGLLGHELGDACLVWGQPREKVSTSRPATLVRDSKLAG
jgi:S-adenosylmethionine:tRNA ribosyltransferase-isomerase